MAQMARLSFAILFIVINVASSAVLSPSRVHPKHRHPRLDGAPISGFFVLPRKCVCKNWMVTYQTGAVACGQGPEFFFHTGTTKPTAKLGGLDKVLNVSICKQFYEVLNTNMCVNLNVGKDNGQWCYVDGSCSELNGGDPVLGTNISWKKCHNGKDDRFRELPLQQLVRAADQFDLDLGLLHKMAYPLSKAGESLLFPDVQAFWGLGKDPSKQLTKSLKKEMTELADSGVPHSFDNSVDGRTPHTIVQGMKVYRVEDSRNKNETHPATWEKLICISGCVN